MTEKITQVRIGKNLIGLQGLEEIFEDLQPRTWATAAEAQAELLNRVAARNYVPAGSREHYGRAIWREFRRFRGEEVPPETPAAPEIKVLGLGCAGCRQFYQQVVNILAARGMEAELQYITDPGLLSEYGVRAFPALVVNGRVVLTGRVPPPAELDKVLLEELEQTQP